MTGPEPTATDVRGNGAAGPLGALLRSLTAGVAASRAPSPSAQTGPPWSPRISPSVFRLESRGDGVRSRTARDR
jgi:hypothetical protein